MVSPMVTRSASGTFCLSRQKIADNCVHIGGNVWILPFNITQNKIKTCFAITKHFLALACLISITRMTDEGYFCLLRPQELSNRFAKFKRHSIELEIYWGKPSVVNFGVTDNGTGQVVYKMFANLSCLALLRTITVQNIPALTGARLHLCMAQNY